MTDTPTYYRAGSIVLVDERNEKGEGKITVHTTSDDCGPSIEVWAARRFGRSEIEYSVLWGSFGATEYRFAHEYAGLILIGSKLALDLPRQDGDLSATDCNVFAGSLIEINKNAAAQLLPKGATRRS